MNKTLSNENITRINSIIDTLGFESEKEHFRSSMEQKDNPEFHIKVWEGIAKVYQVLRDKGVPIYEKEKNNIIRLLLTMITDGKVTLNLQGFSRSKVEEISNIVKDTINKEVEINERSEMWDPVLLFVDHDTVLESLTLLQECNQYLNDCDKDVNKAALKLFEVHGALIDDRILHGAAELCLQRVRFGPVEKEAVKSVDDAVSIYLVLTCYRYVSITEVLPNWKKGEHVDNSIIENNLNLIYNTVTSGKCDFESSSIYSYAIEVIKLGIDANQLLSLTESILLKLRADSTLNEADTKKYLEVIQYTIFAM